MRACLPSGQAVTWERRYRSLLPRGADRVLHRGHALQRSTPRQPNGWCRRAQAPRGLVPGPYQPVLERNSPSSILSDHPSFSLRSDASQIQIRVPTLIMPLANRSQEAAAGWGAQAIMAHTTAAIPALRTALPVMTQLPARRFTPPKHATEPAPNRRSYTRAGHRSDRHPSGRAFQHTICRPACQQEIPAGAQTVPETRRAESQADHGGTAQTHATGHARGGSMARKGYRRMAELLCSSGSLSPEYSRMNRAM